MKLFLAQLPARKEAPPFKFETNPEALEHNSNVLESFNFDMCEALDAHQNDVTTPGSEFREPQALVPLIHSHPHWKDFEKILSDGVKCYF